MDDTPPPDMPPVDVPPVSPDAPAPAAAARPRREQFRVAAQRAGMHAKITLLHVRYVLGYLGAGFAISVPVTLGYQIAYGQNSREVVTLVGLSILYGVVMLVPFVLLEPITRVQWERMRVPEFRLFELVVSRYAALASLALWILSLLKIQPHAERMARWMPPELFWTVFVLMGTAWGKIKLQTYIFPEFYADRGGDRVLAVPPHEP